MLHVAAALKHSAKAFVEKTGGTGHFEEGPANRLGAASGDELEDWGDVAESAEDAERVDTSLVEAAADEVREASGQQALDGRDIAALYERHAPAIYAHCRRLLGSAPAGRDALQESFVRVLQHHRVLGPGDQALRYLYRTSTNVCINLLRQRSVRERAAPLIAAQINAAQSNQPVPGDREFVRLLLEQCDETAVAVALMHFVDGMTQVEVAATLGITRRTVYNRIRRIERLAAALLEPTIPAGEPTEHILSR